MKRHHRMTQLVACLAILVLFGTGAGKKWMAEYAQGANSLNSWERAKAIGALNPNHKQGIQLLFKHLGDEKIGKMDWYIRHEAIDALGDLDDEKIQEKYLKKALKKGSPKLKESILWSFGNTARDENFQALLDHAGDRKENVRRAAVRGLGRFNDKKEALERLIETWEAEKTPTTRVGILCEQILTKTTKQALGFKPKAWRAWWDAEGADFDPNKPLTEDDTEAEEEEKEGSTRARGFDLKYTERGRGSIPLLVIPMQDYSNDFYKPYFRALEDICRIFYVRLPKVTDFPKENLKYRIKTMPDYPVDLLVEAFDKMRQELKIDKFALLAHGFNTTVAQRYLTKYPRHVSHMIMIGPISGNNAWGKILNGIISKGTSTKDYEMRHMGENHYITNYENGDRQYMAKSKDEEEAFDRKIFTLFFNDGNDPGIKKIYETVKLNDLPDSVSPEFDTSRQLAAKVPVLVQMGKECMWTTKRDGKRITSHYPNSKLQIYKNSAMCPFIEETGEWIKNMRKFFDDHPVARRGKKKKKKSRKAR